MLHSVRKQCVSCVTLFIDYNYRVSNYQLAEDEPPAPREQTARIAVNASEIKSPWTEFDYSSNEVPRATGNYLCKYTAAIPLFIPLCMRKRRDAAMKNSVGIFIAEDAIHVLPIDTDWPLWMRVFIKFIQGQAVDGIAEIRWVIVLRYVADAIH